MSEGPPVLALREPYEPAIINDGTSVFVYGPGGTPIEQVRGTTATYLHQDQLGSTVLITSQAGATLDTYTYDPYGSVSAHTGTTTTQLQFDGQYVDSETGLVNLRARIYQPGTGRFTTPDPLAEATRDPYGYTGQDPLDNTDPTGLAENPYSGAGGGASEAAAAAAEGDSSLLGDVASGVGDAAPGVASGVEDAANGVANAWEDMRAALGSTNEDNEGYCPTTPGRFPSNAGEYDDDELAQFAYLHAGEGWADGEPRPTLKEIEDALEYGEPSKGTGNSTRLTLGNVRVAINHDFPLR